MTILLNNKFVDEAHAVVPVTDAGLLYGHGVYESLRTFNGIPKLLDKHLSRLEASAAALFIPLPLPIEAMHTKIGEFINLRQKEEPGTDFRLRITLTAGSKDIRAKEPGMSAWFVTAKPLKLVSIEPTSLQSYPMVRQLPEAKSTAMLPAILGQQHALTNNADEALLVDDQGRAHEGSFCNVFLIKNGMLMFPDTSALKGVTQELLLELTAKLLPAKPATLKLEDFYNADEIFTSGSVRGVVAVNKIDGHSIEAPGPLTQKIQKLYQDWAEQ